MSDKLKAIPVCHIPRLGANQVKSKNDMLVPQFLGNLKGAIKRYAALLEPIPQSLALEIEIGHCVHFLRERDEPGDLSALRAVV
jgi:hypothetical protein